ncbi:Protease inhibitor/seed storage/LTP family [Musa troglodytarum]|uniref:Protease inhibitor/seed storage/LTP family n=1 Tax=Musa troglodytarum TaxID=320322 RepID=A0A9E7FH94_9LILI|nr:Protease inhibitor/seed storage/LTP family [Musa troglodytarum]
MATLSSSSSSRLPFLLVLLLCCASFGGSDFAHDKAECQDTLVSLATCLTYVEGQAKAPTPDCCDGLSKILSKNRTCLCVLIKDRNEPGLGIKFNATLAMDLPTVCHASSNISECPKLLGLPPHSKEAQIFEEYGKANQGSASSGHADGSVATPATSSPTTSSGHEINGGRCSRYVEGTKWLRLVVGGVWVTPLLLVATLV